MAGVWFDAFQRSLLANVLDCQCIINGRQSSGILGTSAPETEQCAVFGPQWTSMSDRGWGRHWVQWWGSDNKSICAFVRRRLCCPDILKKEALAVITLDTPVNSTIASLLIMVFICWMVPNTVKVREQKSVMIKYCSSLSNLLSA